MLLVNPFTQDPVTHPSITWAPIFEASTQVFRIRPHLTDANSVLVIGLNGHINAHNLESGAYQPYVATGGQPTDIIATGAESNILITDIAWNNVLSLRNGQVSGILGNESGILSPVSLCYLGGTVYIADQTGLFSFSTEGIVQRHVDQLGIVALAVVHDCIILAINGENCLKALRPGFHPTIYASGFFGAFRLIDMCVGPDNSVLVVTESIATRVSEAEADAIPQNGFLFVVSCYGVPSACIPLPGTPTSVCFINGRILLSVQESKDVYAVPISAFL